jgi:hypothetical protein
MALKMLKRQNMSESLLQANHGNEVNAAVGGYRPANFELMCR